MDLGPQFSAKIGLSEIRLAQASCFRQTHGTGFAKIAKHMGPRRRFPICVAPSCHVHAGQAVQFHGVANCARKIARHKGPLFAKHMGPASRKSPSTWDQFLRKSPSTWDRLCENRQAHGTSFCENRQADGTSRVWTGVDSGLTTEIIGWCFSMTARVVVGRFQWVFGSYR